jgi:hypothetical protein
MRLFELFEAKVKKVAPAKPRNFVAKNSNMAGKAGAHTASKFTRKEKHKADKERDTSDFL